MKSLIAAVAVLVVAATAAIVFVLGHHAGAGPDPYAGAYPAVTPTPTAAPALTWHPTGRPAGPLPVFHGTGSRPAGRITDRTAGVSYVRFAPPWHRPKVSNRDTTGAELMDGNRTGKLGTYWYAAVYSGLLPAKFANAAPGAYALRAAAELYGRDWAHGLYDDSDRRTEIAGRSMAIDGHRAWLSAFRMTHLDGTPRVEKAQTEVVIAVATGRRLPALVTVTVPSNKPGLLPDINAVVRSLHVVR